MRRMAGAVLAGLGAVMLAFCVCFAVFELIPAYVKMRQTGDGAAFGLGVTILLWWFLPASAALLVCSVLLRRPAGSVPAVLGRPLAAGAWVGAALAVMWVLPQVSGFLWGTCG